MKKQVYIIILMFLGVAAILVALLLITRTGNANHFAEPLSGELNIVSFLGTIVGAIMAASGIIIALVSVYSLFAIEQRTEQKFAQLWGQKQEEQEQRTRKMFQGFALQLEAVNTPNIERAESLMHEALKSYSHLEGARRQMALRLYEATERWFINQSGFGSRDNFTDWRVPSNGVLEVFNHQSRCQNYRFVDEGDSSVEAHKWPGMALEAHEDDDGLVSLCSAKMYSMSGKRKQVISYLEMAARVRDCKPRTFQEASLYLNACADATEIEEIAKWIHWDAPMSKEQFVNWLSGKQASAHSPSWQVLALRKRSFIEKRPKRVFALRLFKIGTGDDVTYQMQWQRESPDIQKQFVRVSELQEDRGFTFDQLWDHIDELCTVVLPMD